MSDPAGSVFAGRWTRCASWLAITAVAGLLTGCVTTPPPLPTVRADQLPASWVEIMQEEACAPPFSARVRLRVDPPDRSAVRLDGTLRATLPDTVRLSGKVGVFRPVFQLVSAEGQSELLIHDERSYWIVPSDRPDWNRMNPAAWRQAIEWSLCPARIFQNLDDADGARLDEGVWNVSGRLRGSPFDVDIAVDPKRRSVLALRLREGEVLHMEASLFDHEFVGGAWVAQRTEFRLQTPGGPLEMDVELVGPSEIDRGEFEGKGLVRPPNWREVMDLRLSVPEVEEPSR